LIAPFERDPAKRLEADWIDRADPRSGPRKIRVDPSRQIVDGTTAVLSFGDYFQEYRRHPELKSLGPDREPCHTWTRGLLSPRHVEAAEPLTRIGKESNRLAETPLPAELDKEAFLEYPRPRTCPGCGAEVSGRRKWCSDRCRKWASREHSAEPSEFGSG
jgi:hypothetical protein